MSLAGPYLGWYAWCGDMVRAFYVDRSGDADVLAERWRTVDARVYAGEAASGLPSVSTGYGLAFALTIGPM